MNCQELWNRCLVVLKDNVPEAVYTTWFAPIVPLKYEHNEILLQLPSMFFYELIEERYAGLLSASLEKEAGRPVKLLYNVLVDKSDNSTSTPIIPSNQEEKEEPVRSVLKTSTPALPWSNDTFPQDLDPQLNPIYNFNTFIEGRSNKLARTAGVSIANDPGRTPFNPLFVFGQSGVGKTHLAQAIGLMAKQLNPEKRVLYVSANLFCIQFTDAVRFNKLNDFLNFYQSIDVLIIDDIQTLSGKDKTQQTFFHIFNHLHQLGKQLILTSDKAPSALQGMEERLLTRFKWGLTAEIEKPDYNLRRAILKNKIYKDGLDIPEDVIDYIAENVVDNVRDLEGVLLSLLAHSTFTDEKIDMNLAVKVVGKIVNTMPLELSPEKIKEVVCGYFSVSEDSVASKSRVRDVANARHIAMYLSKQMTKKSLSEIGRVIGGRDHATVLHSCSVVNDLMETDKDFRSHVEEIERLLKR